MYPVALYVIRLNNVTIILDRFETRLANLPYVALKKIISLYY